MAVTIAAILIFSLTGTKGFSWQRYSLKTRFTNVAGLESGSPVRIAGVEVGTVTAVELRGEAVDVTFQVNKKNRPLITDESVAQPRLGVAPRPERRGHHAERRGHTDPRLGLRAAGASGCGDVGHDRFGEPGDPRTDGDDSRRPRLARGRPAS
ncbi:MAG: MlaD family protein [Vicinamibacterales bacterium]